MKATTVTEMTAGEVIAYAVNAIEVLSHCSHPKISEVAKMSYERETDADKLLDFLRLIWNDKKENENG